MVEIKDASKKKCTWTTNTIRPCSMDLTKEAQPRNGSHPDAHSMVQLCIAQALSVRVLAAGEADFRFDLSKSDQTIDQPNFVPLLLKTPIFGLQTTTPVFLLFFFFFA